MEDFINVFLIITMIKNGCPDCSKLNYGFTFDRFKSTCHKNNEGLGTFYILRCFNDSEEFFKLGITGQTLKQRYHSKDKMPYSYEVIQEIKDKAENIWNLEVFFKIYLIDKNLLYKPSIKFQGSNSECFLI